MHELGLATGVLDSAVKVGKEHGALSVKKISLNVGRRAAVIPQAFDAAFEALKELDEYALCRNAKIECNSTDDHQVYIENIEIETDDEADGCINDNTETNTQGN